MSISPSTLAQVGGGAIGKSSRLVRLRTWGFGWRLLALWLCLQSGASSAGQAPTFENPTRVKAAFIRNFAHYVKWPVTAFDKAGTPWHIGVMGDSGFAEVLEGTLKGRTEEGRAFAIHSADSLEGLPPCQIVFIAFRDAVKRRAVLAALKSKPVLTVGDAEELLWEGGIIRFQTSDRIQMSVNLDQARSVSLSIPAQMLEVSTEVLDKGAIRRLR